MGSQLFPSCTDAELRKEKGPPRDTALRRFQKQAGDLAQLVEFLSIQEAQHSIPSTTRSRHGRTHSYHSTHGVEKFKVTLITLLSYRPAWATKDQVSHSQSSKIRSSLGSSLLLFSTLSTSFPGPPGSHNPQSRTKHRHTAMFWDSTPKSLALLKATFGCTLKHTSFLSDKSCSLDMPQT